MEKQKSILLFFNLLSVLEHTKEDELVVKCNTLLEKIEKLRISSELDNIIFCLYINKGFWTKRQNNKKSIMQRVLIGFDVCSKRFPNIKFENIICKEGYINSTVMNGGLYILKPDDRSVHKKILNYIDHYNNISNLKEIIMVQTIDDLDVYLINEMGSFIPFTMLFVKDKFEAVSTSNVITQQGPFFTEISTTFDGIDGAIYVVDAYSKLSEVRKGLNEEDYAYSDGTIALPDDLNCDEAHAVFESFKPLAKQKTLC